MWNNIVTLYIDDSSIRLLVMRSQRIRKWAEITLEPGLVKAGVVINEPEVANQIRQLIQTQQVREKKVILGYSGLHVLTRPANLPLLPKTMLPEAVAREARRVLPVQLDQLYHSWCTLPGSKNRTQVFMAATPRKTSDSLVNTVRSAGLSPTRMAIKPLALTKLIPENTAILVDIQSSDFDIVIMAGGIAQPIRTVTFPNNGLLWEQKIDLIAADLDRTIKFFDTNNPEKPLGATAQVFVSGDLANKLEVQEALAKKAGRKVVPLTPQFKGMEQVDTARYMVNIAMAFNSPPPARLSTFPAANINVLPTPYLPKPISLAKVVGIPASVVIVGIAIPLIMTIQNNSDDISSLQNNLNNANQLLSQKTLQQHNLKNTVAALEKEVAGIKAASNKIQGSVDYLTTQQENVNSDLAAVLGWPVQGVILTSLSASEGNIIIKGTSSAESNVINYARYLDDTGRYYPTTIVSFTEDHETTSAEYINFTITLQRKGQ